LPKHLGVPIDWIESIKAPEVHSGVEGGRCARRCTRTPKDPKVSSWPAALAVRGSAARRWSGAPGSAGSACGRRAQRWHGRRRPRDPLVVGPEAPSRGGCRSKMI